MARRTGPGAVAGWALVAVVGVFAVFCGFWSMGYTGALISGSTVVDRGTATARSCEFGGPFGRGGIGFWWTCQAEVTWQDGRVEQREFLQSQLAEDDVGRSVEVVEREIPRGVGKGSATDVYRAGFTTAYPWNYVGIVVPIIVGVLLVLTAAHGVLPAAQQWADRKRAASPPAR